ncbi:hypothetical protein CTheo_3258 [Ceratobasidium theobromae]|uniref:BZIP domain-containing protein n=1 Tax=Ceratobasidium theobromae TaxID=1582974 RepID=A0A5N5QNI7_9AGAM|nr:hypothetical protein CTheo_3258 [Ceratobasidium theobromae]
MSSNLQGLNLVQPESPPSTLTDSQDLLSTPLFPDLAAQLDLWTHVNFASDEPFISARDREAKEAETESVPHSDSLTRKEAAHGHFAPAPSPVTAPALAQQSQFDFGRFLEEFGIPNGDGLNLQNAALAQPSFTPSPSSFGALPPPAPAQPAPSESTAAPTPPAKRPRTTTKTQPAPASTSTSSSPTAPSTFTDYEPNITTPLTPAEDKRRRNTAASARFRLKKKEREAALDAKAQALEERVASLERECEGLRRENGWLRGLVVGVTGGVVPSMTDVPIVAPTSSAAATATTTTAAAAAAEKRKRDEIA